jgi:hypothetical protein
LSHCKQKCIDHMNTILATLSPMMFAKEATNSSTNSTFSRGLFLNFRFAKSVWHGGGAVMLMNEVLIRQLT